MKPKVFNYESLGDTLIFAEDLGWEEPKIIPGDRAMDRTDYMDALEDDALEFIESKGYSIVMGL